VSDDLFSGQLPVRGHTCIQCGKPAKYAREMNPPNDSTTIFIFFCRTACEAKHGTNQPKQEN
jgi:hypothetical protein